MFAYKPPFRFLFIEIPGFSWKSYSIKVKQVARYIEGFL